MNPTFAVRVDDDTTILFEAADQDTVVAAGRGAASAGETLRSMLGRVRPVLDALAGELKSIPQRPDRYAVELGVTVTAEAGLVIAKAAADAHFTLTLEWHPRRPAEGPEPAGA